jgi:hypothetical protein
MPGVLTVFAAAGTLAVAVVLCLSGLGPTASSIGLAAVMGWFCLPGVVLGLTLYRGQPGRGLAAWLLGPAAGYVLSSLVLLALWAAGVRRPVILASVPLVAGLAAWLLGRLAGGLTIPRFDRRDIVAVCLLLLLVPLVVGLPYAHVGRTLPEGRAYRAYFTADFVWAMAVVSEVSKGDMPPRNVFYRGDDLRYYWLAHLLPAVEHRAARSALRVEQLLLVNDFSIGLAFVGFLYLFIRHFVRSPGAAAAACVAVVLFSSFEGAEFLYRLWKTGGPLTAVLDTNIDAVSRWKYESMPVDGLQRVLLYQRQHELGYILGLSALLLLVQARERITAGALFLAGCLLGMALLLSSFAAMMLTAIVAVYAGVRLVIGRQWRTIVAGAAAASLPMFGALGLSSILRYVDGAGPLVAIGLNRTASRNAGMAILLSFGPMLLAAAAGLLVSVWKRTLGRFAVLLVMIAVCWLFYFFVDVPEHQHVYVGWRASHLLFIAFAAFCGYALQELWAAGRAARIATVAVSFVVALAAAPMVVIDLYNSQDTSNRSMGPGFRWTVILSPDELAALEWIKRNTSPRALVQIEPESRGRDTWDYIPAFAERRMAAGLPISMIPLRKYEVASARIKSLYQATSADRAHALAAETCIAYLVIGPPERQGYPGLQPLLDASPDQFMPLFRNSSVAVYGVVSLPAVCSGEAGRPERGAGED